MVERKKKYVLQYQLDMIPVKSKDEILYEIERQRQIRRYREEKRGQKLKGTCGSLDLTMVQNMQKKERDRYLKF